MPRPKRQRRIHRPPVAKGFRPIGMPGRSTNEVRLLTEEYEAIKLSDYESLTHLEASKIMGVSRSTFTRIYSHARKKVATAFVENRPLLIGGGHFYMDKAWYRCDDCHTVFSREYADEEERYCPLCRSLHVRHLNATELEERQGPSRLHGHGFCVCSRCGISLAHQRGVPCRSTTCPQCGQPMMRDEAYQPLKNKTMKKIAVSCSGDASGATFNARFGRAPFFALYDGGQLQYVKNPAAEADSGAGPMAVEMMIKLGVGKVVSGHFGPKAEAALQAAGIDFELFHDEEMSVEELIKKIQ